MKIKNKEVITRLKDLRFDIELDGVELALISMLAGKSGGLGPLKEAATRIWAETAEFRVKYGFHYDSSIIFDNEKTKIMVQSQFDK